MKMLKNLFTGALLLTAGLALTSCGKSGGAGSAALEAAYMAGADVAVYIDADSIRKSSLYDALEDIKGAADKDENLKKFQEITGLTEDDVSTVVMAMDFKKTPTPGADMKPEDLSFVAAMKLKKPMDFDKIEEYAKSDDAKDKVKSIERKKLGVADVMTMESSDEEAPKIVIAQIPGANVGFIGFAGDVEEAIKRAASGKGSVPAGLAAAKKELPKGANFSIAIDLTGSLKELVQQGAKGDNPMAAPMKELSSAVIGAVVADNLDLTVAAGFAKPETAKQVATMANAAMIMLKGQMKKTMPEATWIDALAVESKDANIVTKLSMTKADLEGLQNMAKDMTKMPGGPGMDGPDGPGMPTPVPGGPGTPMPEPMPEITPIPDPSAAPAMP